MGSTERTEGTALCLFHQWHRRDVRHRRAPLTYRAAMATTNPHIPFAHPLSSRLIHCHAPRRSPPSSSEPNQQRAPAFSPNPNAICAPTQQGSPTTYSAPEKSHFPIGGEEETPCRHRLRYWTILHGLFKSVLSSWLDLGRRQLQHFACLYMDDNLCHLNRHHHRKCMLKQFVNAHNSVPYSRLPFI
jgi:hypothetical protein